MITSIQCNGVVVNIDSGICKHTSKSTNDSSVVEICSNNIIIETIRNKGKVGVGTTSL